MKEKMKNITQDVTKSEIFHFGMLGVAQCIMFQLWNGQMMYFYTDIFMLAPYLCLSHVSGVQSLGRRE